jgi:hypothetical protein
LQARAQGVLRAVLATPQEAVELANLYAVQATNYTSQLQARQAGEVADTYLKQQVAQMDKAINDLTDTLTLAHLLKWDSVHGKFDGEIGHDAQNIIVRGHKIKILKERDPGALYRGARLVDVEKKDEFTLVPQLNGGGKGANRGYHELADKKIVLPASADDALGRRARRGEGPLGGVDALAPPVGRPRSAGNDERRGSGLSSG